MIKPTQQSRVGNYKDVKSSFKFKEFFKHYCRAVFKWHYHKIAVVNKYNKKFASNNSHSDQKNGTTISTRSVTDTSSETTPETTPKTIITPQTDKQDTHNSSLNEVETAEKEMFHTILGIIKNTFSQAITETEQDVELKTELLTYIPKEIERDPGFLKSEKNNLSSTAKINSNRKTERDQENEISYKAHKEQCWECVLVMRKLSEKGKTALSDKDVVKNYAKQMYCKDQLHGSIRLPLPSITKDQKENHLLKVINAIRKSGQEVTSKEKTETKSTASFWVGLSEDSSSQKTEETIAKNREKMLAKLKSNNNIGMKESQECTQERKEKKETLLDKIPTTLIARPKKQVPKKGQKLSTDGINKRNNNSYKKRNELIRKSHQTQLWSCILKIRGLPHTNLTDDDVADHYIKIMKCNNNVDGIISCPSYDELKSSSYIDIQHSLEEKEENSHAKLKEQNKFISLAVAAIIKNAEDIKSNNTLTANTSEIENELYEKITQLQEAYTELKNTISNNEKKDNKSSLQLKETIEAISADATEFCVDNAAKLSITAIEDLHDKINKINSDINSFALPPSS